METKLNFGFKYSFLCLHKGSIQIEFEEFEREKGINYFFPELKTWAMESSMKSRESLFLGNPRQMKVETITIQSSKLEEPVKIHFNPANTV